MRLRPIRCTGVDDRDAIRQEIRHVREVAVGRDRHAERGSAHGYSGRYRIRGSVDDRDGVGEIVGDVSKRLRCGWQREAL